jgi:hypothetical protein
MQPHASYRRHGQPATARDARGQEDDRAHSNRRLLLKKCLFGRIGQRRGRNGKNLSESNAFVQRDARGRSGDEARALRWDALIKQRLWSFN